MAEMSDTQRDARRKRVKILKRMIVISLVAAILIPTALCVILFFRTGALERKIEYLQSQLEELASRAAEDGKTQVPLQEDSLPEEDASDGSSQENEAVKPQEESLPEAANPELDENLRKVYLTFDDGPSSNTNEILDILAEYDVKATFFVVGKEDAQSQEMLKRIVAEGHTLGMHSYNHKYREIYASVEAFGEDLYKLQDYLYSVTGVESRVYRFPGGSSNTVSNIDMREFISWLNEQGIRYFDWNISSGDASSQRLTADQIVENCSKNLETHKTAVILMHDAAGKKSTVEALPTLLEKILAMEDTVILPITDDTELIQHITNKDETEE